MDADDRARLRALAQDDNGLCTPVLGPDETIALLDHIDQLEARETRVRALHEHRAPEPPYVEYCEHCGADWPCETVRVLDEDE